MGMSGPRKVDSNRCLLTLLRMVCTLLYYIFIGGVLLPDKVNNTVYVRCLPLLANYDTISTYSWAVSFSVGYIEPCTQQLIITSREWLAVIRC
ncbi:hypothetical protein Ahy_B05g074464 [Arachis hypogaea]|uniref:Aminotransferase-like plant mobile domain-containing protein n=1 Tax=Arachis hypogaea TaxID=3818 RepID=A0A444YYX9_ARAHY|nr:hypothetical protein Ahy_B05g074464 [Arachis hypogaea]